MPTHPPEVVDEPRLVAIARKYLKAIEARDGTSLDFYAPHAVQTELPNRLSPGGATRDLAGLRAAAEKGRQVISAERYEVRSAIASGNHVALEVGWFGTLAVPLGTLKPGDEMRAHFAFFLDFEGDKIVRQRNYDCFEPF